MKQSSESMTFKDWLALPFVFLFVLIIVALHNLYAFLKPTWYKRWKCRLLHKKRWVLNIYACSLGSASHHHCHKCDIKH